MLKFIIPRFLINIERWKWNDEYRIYVSNTGRFKDEYKKELPVKISSNGYFCVKTYTGFHLAHRIIMKTWRPTRDMENLTVDHLDCNKRNNTLSNLEWVTKEENEKRAQEYMLDMGRNPKKTNKKKAKDPNYVLTFGTQKHKFNTYEEAACWVIMNFMPSDKDLVKKEKVVNRIRNAVNNHKKYCNYEWKWVKASE